MIKNCLLLSAVMVCVGLISCEEDSPTREDVVVSYKEITTELFSNKTCMKVSNEKSSDVVDAYYFIRIDGNILEGSTKGNQEDYYPYTKNKQSYFGEENRGKITLVPEDIDWSMDSGNRYIFSSDSSGVARTLVSIPSINDMLGVNNIFSYNDSTMKVLWYVTKFTYGKWHVDGIIVPRNVKEVDNTSPYVDTKVGDDIKIEFDPGISESLICKADDFLVRINGNYEEYVKIQDNKISHDSIIITAKGFSTIIKEVQNIEKGKEYTYEVWLWVDYNSFIALPVNEGSEFINGTIIENAKTVVSNSDKYNVKYNIFKGIGGKNDTPYIKVSIHVTKK